MRTEIASSNSSVLDRAQITPTRLPADQARPESVLDVENTGPGTLGKPAFLMNCPFSYSTEQPNNAWMYELEDRERKVNRSKAIAQFTQLYNHMASDAVVFLLPTPKDCRLQDLVFTANLGIVLEHLPGRDTVILSNFTSEPRIGEETVGERFFASMGYSTVMAPHKFEGEAELKHLHGNVYIGGYGIRSDRRVYDWMEKQFDMKVIQVEESDEYLYHLDCSIFPVTSQDTILSTEMFEREEIAEIERYTNIIDVSADSCFEGLCNSVRYHNAILSSSHIHTLPARSEDYKKELKKNRELEDIAVELGLEVNYFNLSEYHKGGALLSCMVMHLNRRSYAFTLL